jgi:hypothetical protein
LRNIQGLRNQDELFLSPSTVNVSFDIYPDPSAVGGGGAGEEQLLLRDEFDGLVG